jgi:hypothetical protein
MAVYVIQPESDPIKLAAANPSLNDIRRILGCDHVEHIPGLAEFEGESADMFGDEDYALRGLIYNDAAVRLRDAGLLASGHRPSPDPIQGPVVILTGDDRLP